MAHQPSHHHHHHHSRPQPNFPPKSYHDLTRLDIAALAPLLLPPHPSAPLPLHHKLLKTRIASLPQHLQARHPWLSSYCSVHSKLNSVVIDSLFGALRAEVEGGLEEVWVPLKEGGGLGGLKGEMVEVVRNLAVLWLGGRGFVERYGTEARLAVKGKVVGAGGKCGACLVAAMGADFQTIMCLAGCFLGRVREGVMRKSRRVWWFEAWVASCVVEAKRGEAVRLMWDVGGAFRRARVQAKGGFAGEGEGGADEGLKGPGLLDRPVRKSGPAREVEQDGDVEVVLGRAGSDVEMDEADEAPDDDFDQNEQLDPTRPPSAISNEALDPRVASSTYSSIFFRDSTHPAIDHSESSLRPRPASSVYSRNTMGHRSTSHEIDDIISLYRHSKLVTEDFHVPSQDPASLPPVPQIPDEFLANYLKDAEPVPEPETARPPPQPRYNNFYPLENVTMPRKDPDRDSKISRIFKQSRERRPALRTGKSGEVKAVFDAVSVNSQESEEREGRGRE